MKMLITLATFNEREQAEKLEERLEKAGVWAETFDESALQHSLFMTKKPLAAFRVRVEKKDLDRAKKLLAEWDGTDGALRQAIRCPECGSSSIEYPQFSRKTLQSGFFAF